MVKNSVKKQRTLERKTNKTSEVLKTQRLKKHQRKMESFWRHNQIDDKQGQTLTGMSQPALEEADDEYYRIESDYNTEMNKRFQQAADHFCARYISKHGYKAFSGFLENLMYYDDKITFVVNGKRCEADLFYSLGGHGYSMF
jgi:hypothetical protein